jgi:hypothetical protein
MKQSDSTFTDRRHTFFLRESRIDTEKAEDIEEGQDEDASEAIEAARSEGAKKVA